MITQNDHNVGIIRTQKVSVDKNVHQLPPHCGHVEFQRVKDYPACPEEWSRDGFFIKVNDGLPLWFDFRHNGLCAILCSVQRLNPVTGMPAELDAGLQKRDEYPWQNYLKMPEQRWLDGYAKDGKVYQFCVTRDESGLAVANHLLPKYLQGSHALAFAFFDAVNPPPVVQPDVRLWDGLGVSYEPAVLKGSYSGQQVHWTSTSIGVMGSSGSSGLIGPGGGLKSSDKFEVHAYNCSLPIPCSQSEPKFLAGDVVSEEGTAVMDSIELKDSIEVQKASMAAGGRIAQRIERDDNTLEYWKPKSSAVIVAYLAFDEDYDKIIKAGKAYNGKVKKDSTVDCGFVGGQSIPLAK